MSGSSPDLHALLDDEGVKEYDDIPTNVKINLIARAVGKHKEETNQKISGISKDVTDIKLMVQSAVTIGRALVISVPIIAIVFSGAAWLFLHVTFK